MPPWYIFPRMVCVFNGRFVFCIKLIISVLSILCDLLFYILYKVTKGILREMLQNHQGLWGFWLGSGNNSSLHICRGGIFYRLPVMKVILQTQPDICSQFCHKCITNVLPTSPPPKFHLSSNLKYG